LTTVPATAHHEVRGSRARPSWGTVVTGAFVVTLLRPVSWALGLAGFLAGGGLILVSWPILVLPTPTGLQNALGGPVSSLVFGDPSPALVAMIVGGTAAIVGLVLAGILAGAWAERQGIAVVLEAAADDELVPAAVDLTGAPGSGRVAVVRLLSLAPVVIAVAAAWRPAYDAIPWADDPAGLAAWREGRTGYPVVDAAMRQLAASGWMHNRARMIAASFLAKDLLVDWRAGEAHFMTHLVDGDVGSNNGGWQWTAGTGTDAAPYFRVFNPVSQGRRFDPTGAYVRRWVPELARVPDAYLHEPWAMPPDVQAAAGCVVGRDYPAPIVDHAAARERALAAYAAAKG
jgi:hypothetical protein